MLCHVIPRPHPHPDLQQNPASRSGGGLFLLDPSCAILVSLPTISGWTTAFGGGSAGGFIWTLRFGPCEGRCTTPFHRYSHGCMAPFQAVKVFCVVSFFGVFVAAVCLTRHTVKYPLIFVYPLHPQLCAPQKCSKHNKLKFWKTQTRTGEGK